MSVAGIEDVEQRMQIAKIAEAFDLDPKGFAKEWHKNSGYETENIQGSPAFSVSEHER